MTKKKNSKKKEERTCKQLSGPQMEQLADIIINAAKCTDVSRGINRKKKRRLPPAGAIMIF